MNAAIPASARAAVFGAIVGLGIELKNKFKEKGRDFVISVIAAIALRAIACLFGWGAAVGTFIGAAAAKQEIEKKHITIAQGAGYTLLGACIGYLAELARIRFAILI